jgi:multidrug resistance efflux pump
VLQTETLLGRLTVFAPRAGTILQVNVRPGEYASATPKQPALLLGDLGQLQVRADIDEQNASRLQPGQPATGYLKGDTTQPIALRFVRIEPYVVPKVSLTGASSERVDTRVLQVIYAFDRPGNRNVYVGQQVDLFIKAEPTAAEVAGTGELQLAKGRL